MTFKYSPLVTTVFAGILYLTTIPTVHGQAVHGDSIDGSASHPSAQVATNVPPAKVEGILSADFETLASYTFNVPDGATNQVAWAKVAKQIPEAIQKLDGKAVRIRGFMMPVKEAAGKTTEFLITRSQPTCCYGGATSLNEFVVVKMSGKGVDEDMDDPVAVEGILHVALIMDSGFVTGIYRMDGQKMIAPKH